MRWLEVKREITEAIESIDRLRGRAHHYSVAKLVPPAFLMDLPTLMTPHAAYEQGMSQWTVPFSVVVGAAQKESSEIELAEFTDEEGPRSVIRAVEGREYTACSDVTVVSIEIVTMTFAGITYLGAMFESTVSGKGALAWR